jgi:hypothetical protein
MSQLSFFAKEEENIVRKYALLMMRLLLILPQIVDHNSNNKSHDQSDQFTLNFELAINYSPT